MPIRYVYRDAEELLASEAVRRSLASELEARGMGDFEGAVDTVVAEHMKTSDAYQNMPTELDKQGFELHFRYGLLHILAASVPEDYHPVTQSDAFKNPSVIEPLDSEVFLSNNTE